MADIFTPNFTIPASNNIFACVWKLTRTMKAAGWTYKASGITALKDTSGTATSDLWGGAADPTTDTYTNISTTTNSGSVSLPQTTITVASTTGFPDSGTISVGTSLGWQDVTYTGRGATTFTGCSGGTGNIANGYPVASGASTIGLDNVAAWIVLSGPETLKIPLSAAPTGTPLRGETITQSTSNAEGELLGYVWDTVGSSGWMAVLPRTGTFDNSNTITGATSTATMTPTGTIIHWNREFMFAKSTSLTDGTIYYICADASGESTQFYSSIASSAAGCTGSVGPAMGGTGNSFPSKGITVRGTGGSTSAVPLVGNLTSNFQNFAQMAATNCIPTTGVSADGSFYLVLSNSTTINSGTGLVFTRLDDTESGDCDPYIVLTPGNSVNYSTWNGTSTTGSISTSYTFSIGNLHSSSAPVFFGYQSRGNGTLDTVNAYTSMPQRDIIASTTYAIMSGGVSLQHRVVNSPATTRPLVLEPLAIYTNGLASVANSTRQYKGRCRWIMLASQGNTYDTYASKTLLAVSVTAASTPCIVIGPYDGTTQTQQ